MFIISPESLNEEQMFGVQEVKMMSMHPNDLNSVKILMIHEDSGQKLLLKLPIEIFIEAIQMNKDRMIDG